MTIRGAFDAQRYGDPPARVDNRFPPYAATDTAQTHQPR